MRARRREREHVPGEERQRPDGQPDGGGADDARGGSSRGDGSGGPSPGGPSSGGSSSGKGGKRSNKGKGRNRKRRNRNRKPKVSGPRNHEVGFWGDVEKLPEPSQDVRITDDPAAVARSLGAPPLPGHERIASHYFTVVYERAVQTAGALAAAGGLIDPEALAEELSDQESRNR